MSHYPLRPKRQVISLSEELRASTPKVAVSISSPNPKSKLGTSFGMSPVKTELSTMLDEDTVSQVPTAVEQPLPVRNLPFIASELGDYRPSAPIVNGFDRLDHAIMQLVQRLPESTLEDKFDVISKWIESYHVDVVPHKLGRHLEIVLGTGKQIAQSKALPSSSCAITTCYAVHQLLLLVNRLRPILGPIVETVTSELFKLVYVTPPAYLSQRLIDVELQGRELVEQLETFRGRMYFQEARDTAKKLNTVRRFMNSGDQVRANQKKVMNSAVKHWHQFSVRCIFAAWRQVVSERKRQMASEAVIAELQNKISKLTSEVAGLKLQVKNKDEQIVDLKKAHAMQLEEAEIEQRSLKYDVDYFSKQAKTATSAKEDAEKALALERNRNALEKQAISSGYNDLKQEANDFISSYFEVRTPIQNSIQSVLGEECSEATLLSWVKMLLGEFIADHPGILDEWKEKEKVSLSLSTTAPVSLRGGGEQLDTFALCLFQLFPCRISLEEILQQFLKASAVEKALNCLAWCKRNCFYLPSVVTDEALVSNVEEGSAASRILFASLAAACAAPHSLISARSPLFDPVLQHEVVTREFIAIKEALGKEEKWETTRRTIQDFIAASCGSLHGGNGSAKYTAEETIDEQMFKLNYTAVARELQRSEADAVEPLLAKYYPTTRKVFMTYARVETCTAALMSESAFRTFVRDIRVGQPQVFEEAQLAELLQGIVIIPKTFTTLLVQLALRRFVGVPPVESMRLLFDNHIRPYAEIADVKPVLQATKDHRNLAPIIDEVRNDLYKIFRRFCADGAPNKMRSQDFARLLVEADEMGRVTQSDVDAAFEVVKASSTDRYINFDGFVALCCIVGLVKNPFPWLSPALRAQKFILETLIGTLKQKYGLKYSPVL